MLELAIALFAVALVLLLAEAHVSTGGLIGAVGVIAAVGGVVLLLLAAGAGPAVVLVVALCLVGLAAASLLLLRRQILRPMPARPRMGSEALVGHVGVVRSSTGSQGQVFVDGSLWRAEPGPSDQSAVLHDGEKVVVERIDGLTLRVRKAEEWELYR